MGRSRSRARWVSQAVQLVLLLHALEIHGCVHALARFLPDEGQELIGYIDTSAMPLVAPSQGGLASYFLSCIYYGVADPHGHACITEACEARSSTTHQWAAARDVGCSRSTGN